jgi:hypothetical protein
MNGFIPARARLEDDRKMVAIFNARHAQEYTDFPERERKNQLAGDCPICKLNPSLDSWVPVGAGVEKRLETEWFLNMGVGYKWQLYHANNQECYSKLGNLAEVFAAHVEGR